MHLYTHISKYTYKKTQINCVYTLFRTSPTLMQPFTEQYYMHLYKKKKKSFFLSATHIIPLYGCT